MGDHNIMGHNPRLGRALVSTGTVSLMPFGVGSIDLRSESTHAVAEGGYTPRFVEGQPVLDPIPKSLETESRVSHKVLGALFLVQPSSVVMVKGFGQIPAATLALV